MLELALELRHKGKTRRTVVHVPAFWHHVCPPRWLIVLQKQLFSLYNVVRVLTYPHTQRATGASYQGTMTQSIIRKLAMAGECTQNASTIPEVATTHVVHVWRSFERQQITLWYDNYRRYISGMDPQNVDKSWNVTAVPVLHTTELPQYPTLPYLDVVAQAVPPFVAYRVRCVGSLLQRSAVPNGHVLRSRVRALMDLVCTANVFLKWRPFVW